MRGQSLIIYTRRFFACVLALRAPGLSRCRKSGYHFMLFSLLQGCRVLRALHALYSSTTVRIHESRCSCYGDVVTDVHTGRESRTDIVGGMVGGVGRGGEAEAVKKEM